MHSFLSVIVMMKNENAIWNEWYTHYKKQGVDHFYVIDHESAHPVPETDNVQVFAWKKHSNESNSNQANAYNSIVGRVNSDWTLVVDADEFVFGVNDSLHRLLRNMPPEIHQLCMPWLIFTSSGMKKHPKCVTKSCINRHVRPSRIGKCATRQQELQRFELHRSILIGESYHKRNNTRCLCPDGSRCRSSPPSFACAHSNLSSSFVRIHHYQSQSYEDMLRKSNGGDADVKVNKRTPSYWKELENAKVVEDRTLSDKSTCMNDAQVAMKP